LASTTSGGFDQGVLSERLSTFELSWQLEKWGVNEGEEWFAKGNLLEILRRIKTKWGYIL
jgi:hypothetical protein